MSQTVFVEDEPDADAVSRAEIFELAVAISVSVSSTLLLTAVIPELKDADCDVVKAAFAAACN